MLYTIVFTCGAALMGLELVAARVLAPVLGNSIYVWGAVISVIMVALSVGYWLGGQIADRWGARHPLPVIIAASGLVTVMTPLTSARVLPMVADLGPRLGSLAAAMMIFFLPALLLATVSPLGITLAANRGMQHLGRSAGSLYAVSTAGSIAGTLATSFWLIPLLSLEPLLVWTGFVLVATAFLSLALPATETAEPAVESVSGSIRVQRRSGLATTLFAAMSVIVGAYVLIQVAPASPVNAQGETVLFRKDTQYHRITVTEDSTTRHLRFDSSHQTAVAISDGLTSRIKYPDYMHLALAIKPDAQRVLVLGLGGGAVTKRMWHDYPWMLVDSVEIDPVVVQVARDYFGLPQDPRLRVFTEDARRFIQASTETYDIIIMDAYYSDALPFHLTTEEFLREIKSRLAPDGVMAYNVISSVEGDRSKLFRSMYRTAGGVWDRLWVFPIGIGKDGVATTNRNIIVLATDADVSQTELVERIEQRVDGTVDIPDYETFGNDLYTGIVPVRDVPILTDSHAPTDSLISVN